MEIWHRNILICIIINLVCSENVTNEDHEWIYSEKLAEEGYEIIQYEDHNITVSHHWGQ